MTPAAVGSRAVSAGDGVRPKVAYMLGVFPALTETFVLREMGAIRRRGVEVVVCAIRRPPVRQPAVRLAAFGADAPCLYARPDSVLRHGVANLACLLRRPRRYLAALRTFLRAAAGLAPRE